MVQIRVGDVYLDLYEFDPPKLNFAIEDITDTSARSEFTRTFRIPATSNNNAFFETAFEINGQDFDVTQKIPAELMVDGILFRQGELRLNKIFITRENEKIDYECIFFGVTRSLATSIGDGTINQLDLSAYDHDLTSNNVVLSWQAYPEGASTDGLLDGNVIYPLIDHGNTYTGVVPNQGEIRHNSVAHSKPFTNSSYDLDRERFKPMVRAKAVWDAIFNEAGFTYTSSFINTGSTFNSIYLSAFGNETSILNAALQNTGQATGNDAGPSTGEEIDLDVIILDPGNNFSNGRYVVPISGTYTFAYSYTADARNATPISAICNLRRFYLGSTTTLDTVSDTFEPGQDDEILIALAGTHTVSLPAGAEIFINFSSGADNENYQGSLTITDAPGQISIAPLLDDDYKKIDFVRDIITKFRLVLAPDKNDSSNFIIEPWATYIQSGDEFDWTDKLDFSKDFQISPLFYTQKAKIEYRDSEGGDDLNNEYQEQFNEPFGTLRIISNNELLEGERTVETQIIPFPVTQILGAQQANNGMDNTIIGHNHIHQPQNGNTLYLPVDSNKRLVYYNGLKSTGTSAAREDTWYMEDDLGVATGFTDYPMVSSYSDFPLVASSLDLNWQREDGYIEFGLHDKNIGNSVYDVYWSNYINSLYDRWARRVTAYFILNSDDLREFSFDDVIFVKDTYYYVEKIYDVPLGEKASVKVDLIKILSRT
jgi:hypothetical protein